MPNLIDLTGQRFGRLLVLNRSIAYYWDGPKWDCICDCGNTTTTAGKSLKRGHTKSCGCLQKEAAALAYTIHGRRYSSEYKAWKNMLGRCNNPNDAGYRNYGARGITVCERWHKFENFLADMGNKLADYLSLDRINNNGNYEPGNCRWTTMDMQAQNRRAYCPRGRQE